MVVTANGEVQTNEEAQVDVHDLGLFATVQLLEETPAVLSLGKLCEEHRYSYELGQRSATTFDPKMERILHSIRTISHLLLFQGCRPVRVPVRLQQRHCRTCLHQVQRRVYLATPLSHLLRQTGEIMLRRVSPVTYSTSLSWKGALFGKSA